MSYNTRRNQNYGSQPISSIGQRRSQVASTNFIPGGQLNRNQNQSTGRPFQQQQQPHQQQQNKPPQQQVAKLPVKVPQQTKPPASQQVKAEPGTQAVQSQQQPLQVDPRKQPLEPPQQQEQPSQQEQSPQKQPPQQQVQTNMQKSAEQFIEQQQEIVPPPPSIGNDNIIDNGDATAKKPFWMKRTGRISKAEKMRKRNMRLRKLLQPKNALMVLNELIGSASYVISEAKCGFDDMFKATVSVDGVDHIGTGKSKVAAKTAAAEAAVKSIVLKKMTTIGQSQSISLEEDGDEKMEEESNEEAEQVSWSHIASFAIHKLFSSWDEDGNIADMFSRANSPGQMIVDDPIKRSNLNNAQAPEQKPAKKIPENALHMNPIMLLNQMHPSAKYEEVSKVGNPPHIQFTVKCTVMDQCFTGTGPNKKAARKQAAFAACSAVLGLQYPPEILNEIPKKSATIKMDESYTPY